MSDDVTQLARILGMMGSEHDGETLNAARLAERLRKKLDKTWVQLLTGASSSGNGFDLMRAHRAERRVTELETALSQLRRENEHLRNLRADQARTSQGHRSTSSRGKGNVGQFRLDADVERLSVQMLLEGWITTQRVKHTTGWNTPKMSIRNQLASIAKRRGLQLDARSGVARHAALVFRFRE